MRPGVLSSSANPGRVQVKLCFICTCVGLDLFVCSSGACGIKALRARFSVGVSSLCLWCRLRLVLLHLRLRSPRLRAPCLIFRLFVACASGNIIVQFLEIFWFRLPDSERGGITKPGPVMPGMKAPPKVERWKRWKRKTGWSTREIRQKLIQNTTVKIVPDFI